MNRQKFVAAAVVGLALCVAPSGGRAETETDTLSVIAPPSVQNWSENVFQQFERKVRYPAPMGTMPASEGIVAVKFNCSEDGVPSQVQLYKTSGHGDLDRATVRAVERIATLHPLPRGVGHDQQYIVRVLFANSEGYAQRNMTRLREDAARSNAWVGRSGATTAMLELVPPKG